MGAQGTMERSGARGTIGTNGCAGHDGGHDDGESIGRSGHADRKTLPVSPLRSANKTNGPHHPTIHLNLIYLIY